jgi:hypothetical protein
MFDYLIAVINILIIIYSVHPKQSKYHDYKQSIDFFHSLSVYLLDSI